MNLNILGAFNSVGYGQVCVNMLKALERQGCKPALYPLSTDEATIQQNPQLYSSCINRFHSEEWDANAPSVNIWHQFALGLRIGKGLHCGFPFFELNIFKELEKKHLNQLDLLFVASDWAKHIVEANYIKTPTEVVPLGVDTSIFRVNPEWDRVTMRKQLGFTEDDYIFINVGKWSINKGHDVLKQCFQQAFPSENVKLLMVCLNPCIQQERNDQWFNFYEDDSRITCVKQRFYSQLDLAKLYFIADCGVFPARAEAWNLEACEMLAMNKPVILTNYSGHTAYSHDKNTFLVNINGLEVSYDGQWFFGHGEWAKLSKKEIDSFADYMRHCYMYQIKENINDVSTKFTWDNSAKTLIRHLQTYVLQKN